MATKSVYMEAIVVSSSRMVFAVNSMYFELSHKKRTSDKLPGVDASTISVGIQPEHGKLGRGLAWIMTPRSPIRKCRVFAAALVRSFLCSTWCVENHCHCVNAL